MPCNLNFYATTKKGEEHYNTISAFIKSMRASQPDAAIYYLARMIDSGEDPKFIARRMVIFVSEDIGSPNPLHSVVANDVFRACETYRPTRMWHQPGTRGGFYLAQCKKDRCRAYDAYAEAMRDVVRRNNRLFPKNP